MVCRESLQPVLAFVRTETNCQQEFKASANDYFLPNVYIGDSARATAKALPDLFQGLRQTIPPGIFGRASGAALQALWKEVAQEQANHRREHCSGANASHCRGTMQSVNQGVVAKGPYRGQLFNRLGTDSDLRFLPPGWVRVQLRDETGVAMIRDLRTADLEQSA
jgi:hypothetical protein